MKTLLGVLLLALMALFTCSDTPAGKSVEKKGQDANQLRCLETVKVTRPMVSVKDIPPVGCAIPMAQMEKAWQAQ